MNIFRLGLLFVILTLTATLLVERHLHGAARNVAGVFEAARAQAQAGQSVEVVWDHHRIRIRGGGEPYRLPLGVRIDAPGGMVYAAPYGETRQDEQLAVHDWRGPAWGWEVAVQGLTGRVTVRRGDGAEGAAVGSRTRD